ncbi:MAG: hypothetical protein JHC95_13975 [Solirubrobacteraceae bacterium]|nr:hypothetical protein [Solirubrobacteraceae bacterium]
MLRAASQASGSGKAASIFWNVDGLVIFSCARRGQLLGSLELLDVDAGELEDIPKSLHRPALRANDDGSDPVAVGAAMVETFTGTAFGPDVLESGEAYGLTPPPDELKDFHPSQMWLYEDNHPDLIEAVLAATAERQRAVAIFAARAAAREASLEDETGVRELLHDLEAGTPRIPSAVTALAAAARRRSTTAEFQAMEDQAYGRDSRALERVYLNQRAGALEVLRQATHAEPVSAAVTSLDGLLGVVRASVDRYAAVYRQDESGRRLERVDDLASDRASAVAAVVGDLLATNLDVTAAVNALLPPMTAGEREAALRDHVARYERGDFDEYQISRPSVPGSDGATPDW